MRPLNIEAPGDTKSNRPATLLPSSEEGRCETRACTQIPLNLLPRRALQEIVRDCEGIGFCDVRDGRSRDPPPYAVPEFTRCRHRIRTRWSDRPRIGTYTGIGFPVLDVLTLEELLERIRLRFHVRLVAADDVGVISSPLLISKRLLCEEGFNLRATVLCGRL